MEKATVEFSSGGESGNIYWILAAAQKSMKNQGKAAEFTALNERVKNCPSYDAALEILREGVNLIDLDGEY
jgi:hypothetical protein